MISIQRSQASILLDHFRGEREQMKHLIFIISMLPYTLLGSDVPDYRRWYQEVKPELIEANLARRLLYVKKNGENWRIVRGPKKSLYSAMPAPSPAKVCKSPPAENILPSPVNTTQRIPGSESQ